MVVSVHFLSALWHIASWWSETGLVAEKHLDSSDVVCGYIFAAHWVLSRMCLTTNTDHIPTEPSEKVLDVFLMFLCLVLVSLYFGQLAAVAITRAHSRPQNLWTVSQTFAERYGIHLDLKMRVGNVLEASHYLNAGERLEE